jgi:tagatose 6-phosphate kinase
MILVVGLSPAWQRTLVVDALIPGRVNRARRVREAASGKGVNVARVASILGANVRLLTVAGGARGRLLQSELKRQRLSACIVPVQAETRICQTLLAGGSATELVEEAGLLRAAEVKDVTRAFAAELRAAEWVVLTGTVPRGCGGDFYARLVREAIHRGVRVLMDAQGEQLMNALRSKPFLVKINRDELAVATGARGGGARGLTAAARVLNQLGAQWIIVTRGPHRVQVFQTGATKRWTFQPPGVAALNPTGSGDAMLAGIAVGLARGRSVLDAVQFGLACGAANAMTAEPGFVRVTDVRRLCSTGHQRVPIV